MLIMGRLAVIQLNFFVIILLCYLLLQNIKVGIHLDKALGDTPNLVQIYFGRCFAWACAIIAVVGIIWVGWLEIFLV